MGVEEAGRPIAYRPRRDVGAPRLPLKCGLRVLLGEAFVCLLVQVVALQQLPQALLLALLFLCKCEIPGDFDGGRASALGAANATTSSASANATMALFFVGGFVFMLGSRLGFLCSVWGTVKFRWSRRRIYRPAGRSHLPL